MERDGWASMLRSIAEARTRSDTIEYWAVTGAREYMTWEGIGQALRMTGAGARQRHIAIARRLGLPRSD